MENFAHSIECPICHNEVSAETEGELMKRFKTHVKDAHDMDMTEEKMRGMMKM